MSIIAISKPSELVRCSCAPKGLVLNFSPTGTLAELEKAVNFYTSEQLKEELANGKTLEDELYGEALRRAADASNSLLIEEIINKRGKDLINMGDKDGMPPLFYARM